MLFLGLTLVSLIPVLAFRHFPTLDGPAHLHNANLLGYLLCGDGFVGEYFTLNNLSTPNWLGHLLIIGVQRLFGSVIAEKAIATLCIAGMAYSFRFLIKTINGNQLQPSYLIFPFTYSFFLYLGFFNFIISIALLFVSIALYLQLKERYSLYKNLAIIILVLLSYFAHPFGFLAYALSVGLFTLMIALHSASNRHYGKLFIHGLVFASTIAIPSILYLNYTGGNVVALSSEKYPFGELARWLYRLRPLVVFNFGREQVYTTAIFLLLVSLCITIAMNKFLPLRGLVEKGKADSFHSAWLYAGLVILLLYFIVPNQINSGGYVSDRLNFLVFIFLMVWLSSYIWNKKMLATASVVAVLAHLCLLNYYTKQTLRLNGFAKSMYSVSAHIEPESVLLPIGSPPDWMMGHLTNYLGADRKVVILENYEAFTGYFPLKWNWQKMPNLSAGGVNLRRIGSYSFRSEIDTSLARKEVDYIIFTGELNTVSSSKILFDSVLNKSYQSIYTSSDSAIVLYKRLENRSKAYSHEHYKSH
jgi:hypothetical protein